MANDPDDDVFLQDNSVTQEDAQVLASSPSNNSSSSSNTTVVTVDQSNATSNGLSRSRRSHFSRKDSTPEMAIKNKSESKQIVFFLSQLFELT